MTLLIQIYNATESETNPQVKVMAWAAYFEELEEYRRRYNDEPTAGLAYDNRRGLLK